LSIKQAAEGGEVAAEYREHFGEHAFDSEGNYIGGATEGQQAWEEYFNENGELIQPGEPGHGGETVEAADTGRGCRG
jgi:small subunit ribosomal protein S1